MPAIEPVVRFVGAHGAMVETQGLVASYWLRAWDVPVVREFQQVFAAVRGRQPEGAGLLMTFRVSGLDARAFTDQATRDALAAMHRAFDGYFRDNCVVLEGTGFVAAALRSTAWTMTQLLRLKNAPRYFDTERDAAAHLGRVLAPLGATASSITAAATLARHTADIYAR